MDMGEAIDKLAKELGADISIHILPHREESVVARRQINAKLVNQFRGHDVELYEFSPNVPVLTVIWDRPQTYTSPDRILLRKALIEANIWDHSINHLWCVPEKLARPITLEDTALYRPWLLEAVQAAGARYVLLVGTRPHWQWRPDLRLNTTQGGVYVWRQRQIVCPVVEPSTMPKHELPIWRRQVAKFLQVVKDGGGEDSLNQWCITCGGQTKGAYWYDPDGVPWCKDHAVDGVKAQEKGVAKWRTLTINAGQTSLLPPGD